MIGIEQDEIPKEEQYYFQGLEPKNHHKGMRFLRLASLYPDTINYVRFYKNDQVFYVAYEESFMVNWHSNWMQKGVDTVDGEVWRAEVVLVTGEVINITHTVTNL